MIAKKNSRFDLEQKRIVLFQVGLLAAGSFVLAAFTYTSELPSEFDRNVVSQVDIDYQLIEPEEPKMDEVVVKRQDQNQSQDQSQDNNAGNSQAISENSQSTQNSSTDVKPGLDLPDVGDPNGGLVEIIDDELDPWPKTPARYVGGYAEMQKHIIDVLEFPEIDRQIGTQGKVYLIFVVERDGSVTNVGIERGVSETIDREAKRIVRSFPKWIPGENEYGPVRTQVRLPINFVVK